MAGAAKLSGNEAAHRLRSQRHEHRFGNSRAPAIVRPVGAGACIHTPSKTFTATDAYLLTESVRACESGKVPRSGPGGPGQASARSAAIRPRHAASAAPRERGRCSMMLSARQR
eukprot:4291389-Prymnesium_polylepis.1